MTLKHTPGPWHVDGSIISGFVDRDIAPHYLAPICYLDADWIESAQVANARLISAAPDLLAALQSLLEVAGYLGIHESPYTDAASNARLAISKATGE